MHDPLTHPDGYTKSNKVLSLLKRLLSLCRQAIQSRSPLLPFYSFRQIFHSGTLSYSLDSTQQYTLNPTTLHRFTRVLQMITICIQNLQRGTTITKRNLFYKLGHYYDLYSNIDKDLRFVCQNLTYLSFILESSPLLEVPTNCGQKILRTDLGIIASSRCVLQGNLDMVADGRTVSVKNSQIQIKTVPTCKTICATCYAQQIIIIEKQSMFYQLANALKLNGRHEKYLLISAKGYPDQITRKILHSFSNQKYPFIKSFYYLGDYDVFGFDIFLFYALGDWFCQGLLPKIELIEPCRALDVRNKVFDWNSLRLQMSRFTNGDRKKVLQIKNKWLDPIENPNANFSNDIKVKVKLICESFQYFIKQESKCELQLLSKHAYNKLWVEQLIQRLKNNLETRAHRQL